MLERLVASDAAAESYRAATPEDLVITAGSNQLLHLVGETLCDPGDIVLCDSPSYFVFKGLLANMGVRSVGVDVDEGGMILESLSERLKHFDARENSLASRRSTRSAISITRAASRWP